jgi:hypothetical protein
MNRSSWSAWIALAVLAPLQRARSEEGSRPVVIRGCSMLDVAGGKLLADRTVVLEGGKVRAIGTPEDPVELMSSTIRSARTWPPSGPTWNPAYGAGTVTSAEAAPWALGDLEGQTKPTGESSTEGVLRGAGCSLTHRAVR